MKVKSQSSPTLSDPMDCSPPGSSIHGIFQAKVLEWGAIAFSGHSDDTNLTAESEEELKSLLMKVKEENEKAVLKFSIQKTKMMVSYPFCSWQTDGEMVKTVTTLFSWAPKSLQMVTQP